MWTNEFDGEYYSREKLSNGKFSYLSDDDSIEIEKFLDRRPI